MPDFEITSPDGKKFIVTAPEGASQDEVLKYAQQNMQQAAAPSAPERGTGEKVLRSVGLVGKGLNDAVGATVAAPVEAMNWLLKQPGRAVEALTGANVPNVLPEGGFYTERAQGALNALGRNDTPENTLEKIAYGTGKGVGNVVGMLAPAGAVSQLAPVGSLTRGVAGAMTGRVPMQLASGVAGGVTEELTGNKWLGMAAGLGVPLAYGGARALISPGAVRANPETARLVEVAKNEGIPLTPGQVTGSRPMRTLESVFGTIPSTAAKQEAVTDAQRVAFNKAVLARAGENGAERATPEVVQDMLDRAGQTMQTVAERNTLKVDADAMQSVQAVAQEAKRYLTKDQSGPVLSRVQDFIDKIDTKTFTVDGKAFAALDSALGRQARGTMDGNARSALTKLQDALRTAMDNSMSGEDAALWSEARRHYANGKIVQQAMNQPSISTAAGNIPPAALSSALAQGPSRNYAMGRGDLNDLSRVGRAFIQDAIPNSGTAERLAMQSMLSSGGAGLGGLGAGVEGASAGLLASMLGPRLAQGAYYSRPGQAYLTNQFADRILPRTPPGLLGAITAGHARSLLQDR